MRNHLHEHHAVNVGIVLIMIGLMVFLYALILSDPVLLHYAIKMKGAEEVLHGAAPHARTSQEAFMMATVLIGGGAGLDVWRRLHPAS